MATKTAVELLRLTGVPRVGRYPVSAINDATDGRALVNGNKIVRPQPCVWQPHLRGIQPNWKPGGADGLHGGAAVGDLALHQGGLKVFNGRVFKDIVPLDRFTLTEHWRKRPLLNSAAALAITNPGDAPATADALRDDLVANTLPSIVTSAALIAQANLDFEIAGTNAANAGSTFSTVGGVNLATAGAANDQIIVVPHQDTTISAWAAAAWNTANRLLFETQIRTSADLTSQVWWSRLGLTNPAPFNLTTDDNQMLIWFNSSVDAFLHWSTSIGGTDATGILTDKNGTKLTVLASTNYNLEFGVDENRYPYFIVNGILYYHGTTAMTSLTTLKPSVGVETLANAARSVVVRPLALSMDY